MKRFMHITAIGPHLDIEKDMCINLSLVMSIKKCDHYFQLAMCNGEEVEVSQSDGEEIVKVIDQLIFLKDEVE